MAYINTNDLYIKYYCKKHPEADGVLENLLEQRNQWLCRYGNPVQGGISENGSSLKEISKVKAVQLDLLRELKRVCDENGLKLFLVYGSLLGAVRSGGMIDGDDDIDVAMLREDYDKLILLTDQFKSPYFLQNNYNDNCFFGGYIKLRNSETTAINPMNWYINCNEGIFIDIFPIDKSFELKKRENRKLWKIHHLQRLLYAKSYGFYAEFNDMPLLVWKAYKYFGKLLSRQKLLRLFDKLCRLGDTNSKKLGIYTHYSEKISARYVPAFAYENPITMTYEGIDFYAPEYWDDILCSFYGYGYLTPSFDKEGFHAFYKSDVPYQKYKSRFTRLYGSAPNKQKRLILVGDQELFTEYKIRFPSSTYKPDYSFTVEEIEALKEYKSSDTYLVIAAFNFLSVEEKIRSLGFTDYSIFIYDRSWLLLPDISASERKYKMEKLNEK
ncbi:MAG: LicD family protein [Treponema sp.]|nr:LicD family protein [Treponema sp.]